MGDDVASIEDAREDRRDTDPRIALDRIQIEAQGKELALLRTDFDRLYSLVRKIGDKLGVVDG